MTTTTTFSLLPLVTALLLSAACDAQNSTDYQGEALAEIVGTVSSSVANASPELEAVLVWENSAGSPDTVTGQSAEISGSFPANFHLEVFAPPPDEALNDYTSSGSGNARIGVAYISALPPGPDFSASDEPPTVPIAVSEDYMLVYVESDVAAGTLSAELLGGALTAGFYLMQVLDVDDPNCPSDIFDCLRVAPEGINTNVPLILSNPEDIDLPNWS